MTDNLSFVLRGIGDVVFEQRPIPEGYILSSASVIMTTHRSPLVHDDQVLVQVKKTGVWRSIQPTKLIDPL
jgi:hypothetical protein